MSNIVLANDRVAAEVIRRHEAGESLKIKGVYDIEHIRNGEVIHRQTCSNLITTEGKRYLLDAALANSAAGYAEQTAWYVMLASTNTTPVVTINYDVQVFTEFTSYTGNRQAWTGVLDAGGAASITNSAAKAAFAITGAGTLYGAALVSLDTKSDHTAGDYMMSYSLFTNAINVVNADTVNVTITISLT